MHDKKAQYTAWVRIGNVEGLVDLGPILMLWYFAATIQVIRSLKWFDRQLSSRPKPSSSVI